MNSEVSMGNLLASKEAIDSSGNHCDQILNVSGETDVPLKKVETPVLEESSTEHRSNTSSTNERITSQSTLDKEVTDAVAEALNSSSNSSMKEVSLLSGSSMKSSSEPKKSPLTSSEPQDFRESTGNKAPIKYSPKSLRLFKHKVMEGALKDLRNTTQSKVPSITEEERKQQVAFAVDETVCGLVIGKGGVNVKKLEKAYDVEIIVNAKKSETATKRIVTIIGSDSDKIERARQALDYQQVFIPILGVEQKKLVASNSEDKFQRWRSQTGVVRIEFENELESYDPTSYFNSSNVHEIQTIPPGYKLSNREIIKQKKEESNDLHSGFLRLVGTKAAVDNGRRLIEGELAKVNKSSQSTSNRENIKVHNMETNYSRVAAYNSQYPYSRQKPGYYKPQVGSTQPQSTSAIYQLWQQQQQQGHNYFNNYTNYNPYRQNMHNPYNSIARELQPRHHNYAQTKKKGLKYSKMQRNLDDLLLDGKLSVDDYAMKLSKQSLRK